MDLSRGFFLLAGLGFGSRITLCLKTDVDMAMVMAILIVRSRYLSTNNICV